MDKYKVFLKKVFAVFKNEIRLFFSTPIGYVILILFIIAQAVASIGVGKFLQFGTTDLGQYFGYIAFGFALVIPALTMSSFAKEKQNGTMEYLTTQPLSEFEILFGKLLGYATLVALLLLTTLPFIISLGSFKQLDFGQVFLQYFGAFVLGISLSAIGMAVSASNKSEIGTFLITLVISATLILIGSSTFSFVPVLISGILEKFGLLSHYQSISRGVLDLRDVLYFGAFIVSFLALVYIFIIKDKFPRKDTYLRNSIVVTVIIICIAILIGWVGQLIPGRIDLTVDRKYTLSQPTVDVINNVKDLVNIDFYYSTNLPQEFQSELRNVQDALRDYQTTSAGKINVNTRAIKAEDDDAKTAESEGISQISFNVSTSDTASQVVGYFGLVIKYLDKKEVVNFNATTLADLEYQLTLKIKKLTAVAQKNIAVLGNAEYKRTTDLATLNAQLSEIYNVSDLTFDETTKEIPANVDALIIVNPDSTITPQNINTISEFFAKGKSIFFMTETYTPSSATMTPNSTSIKDLFSDYGIIVNQDAVYDKSSNNVIAINNGGFTPQILDYPFWVIALPSNTETGIEKGVDSLSLLYSSSIAVDKNKNADTKIYELIKTTTQADVRTGSTVDIGVQQEFDPSSTSSKVMAVAIENKAGGRAVIVGDSDYVTDSILDALAQRQSQDKYSLSFALNSIAWMVNEDQLGTIITKNRVGGFINLEAWQTNTVIGFGVILPLVAVGGFSVFKYIRRRKNLNRNYQE